MKVTPALPVPIANYLHAINSRDAAAFQSAFSPDAIVHDIGREIRGHAVIMKWAAEEIFAVNVTLELLSAVERDGQTILTVQVDGTFDRTGLPDPLIMDHLIILADGRITTLRCRLTSQV
ncbi:MAG: nuclear transport factor 2 family protein [Verrucomicrobiota bacterium]